MVGKHAVVMGGSMGGIVAARILASRFDRVTVVERDTLPAEAKDRRGVPQSPHAHALLISGRQKLDRLFPGLTRELISGGAVPFDPGCDLLFHQMGALRTRFPSGKLGISLSRAYLEHAVRARVRALPNVQVRDETSVTGLTGLQGRVTGVVLDGGATLYADLVVDATGRSAHRTEAWLRDLGFPAPKEVRVKIDVGYTTRLLHRIPGDRLKDDGLLLLMSAIPPHDKRAAAAFAIEGNRWMVTLGGWHREHAPVDPVLFEKFATDLPFPHLSELLSRAEPVDRGEARKFTYPAARRRYFERLRTLPAGYVALGDAICSFNPLYGQGMTVATQEAMVLARCLDRFGVRSAKMARAYYRGAASAISTPWQTATGGDFVYAETEGPRPLGNGIVNRYVRQAMLASHVSPDVHEVMMDIQHLLTPTTAILRPRTVARTLLAARRSPAWRDATAPSGS
ncbi:FAD-dependent oxidoreductase [Streptomyces coeruleorubidus]|uniref:FAD-dependent oxidoreductase n=1 Tax=Streptomyces coeruleorubidus TaxID=116188 RepID=UPI0037A48DCF